MLAGALIDAGYASHQEPEMAARYAKIRYHGG
jgi:hypothetical protein